MDGMHVWPNGSLNRNTDLVIASTRHEGELHALDHVSRPVQDNDTSILLDANTSRVRFLKPVPVKSSKRVFFFFFF